MSKRSKTDAFPIDKIAPDGMPIHEVDDALFVRAMMLKLGRSFSVKAFGKQMGIVTHAAGNRQTRLYSRLLHAFSKLGETGELVKDGQKWRLLGSAVFDRMIP